MTDNIGLTAKIMNEVGENLPVSLWKLSLKLTDKFMLRSTVNFLCDFHDSRQYVKVAQLFLEWGGDSYNDCHKY